MDIPDLIAFLNSQNHLRPEEIKIQEVHKPKRLDQEVLEQYWAQRSQGPQMEIPFWANADGVVQQIMHQDACRDASISPSPSPRRTPSLLYSENVSGSASLEDIATTVSTCTSSEFGSGDQALRGSETPLSELSQSGPADSHKDERRSTELSGKLAKKRPKAIAGWRSGGNTRVTKRSWRSAMGLRSSQVTRFYELA